MLPKKSAPQDPKQKVLFTLCDYLCVRFSYTVSIMHARLPTRQIKVAFLLPLEVELEICFKKILADPVPLFE